MTEESEIPSDRQDTLYRDSERGTGGRWPMSLEEAGGGCVLEEVS